MPITQYSDILPALRAAKLSAAKTGDIVAVREHQRPTQDVWYFTLLRIAPAAWPTTNVVEYLREHNIVAWEVPGVERDAFEVLDV